MPDRTGLPRRDGPTEPRPPSPPPGGSDTGAAIDPAEAAGLPAGDALAAARHYERGMSPLATPSRNWWPGLVMATLVVVLAVWMFLT